MFEVPPPSEVYRRACKRLGKTGPDMARRKRLESHIRDLKKDIRELESGEPGDKIISSKRKELERLTRILEQRDFKRAMRITGMGLRVEEVVRFSTVMAMIAMLAGLAITIPLAAWFGLDGGMTALAAAGAALALPLITFMLLVNYPESLARSLEMEAFGSAPEVINYMVMSMELSPSLDRAVMFAAENSDGPMAQEMRSLVWKVQAREFATTEEALMSYANELQGSNEELRSAIYNLLSASKESEGDKMRSSLRRASDSVLVGTRQRVEGFAASLATPATVLFSLGILLPMIIGSMLPMMSMGGFGPPAGAEQDDRGWLQTLGLSILVMNIAFPATAFLYARKILAKRPGIHTAGQSEHFLDLKRMAGAIITFLIFASAAYLIGTRAGFWGLEAPAAALVLILGVAAGAWYLLALGRDMNAVKRLESLEDRMPDMLFQLGSRLGEGMALERAMEDVAETMRETEMGEFLDETLARLRRSGAGISDVLFSREFGLMANHPSRKLRAAMRLVVEAAGKDPETAGNILTTMSNHMRELANSDKEMRLKLRSTIDSMKNTAILFAPVIMGVTVGLYALLSQTFGEMNGAETMPTPHFIMIIGIYLLMTVTTIMYFGSGIENGRGRWKREAGIALPVAAVIFCVCSMGALLAFG